MFLCSNIRSNVRSNKETARIYASLLKYILFLPASKSLITPTTPGLRMVVRSRVRLRLARDTRCYPVFSSIYQALFNPIFLTRRLNIEQSWSRLLYAGWE